MIDKPQILEEEEEYDEPVVYLITQTVGHAIRDTMTDHTLWKQLNHLAQRSSSHAHLVVTDYMQKSIPTLLMLSPHNKTPDTDTQNLSKKLPSW